MNALAVILAAPYEMADRHHQRFVDIAYDGRRLYHHIHKESTAVSPQTLVMPQQDTSTQFAEAERAELARVVEALARWPRLSHLLRYMGEKLFCGEVDQLNEYNIATDVLGRSKTVFNAAEDAIARVETHRLRKRLATFYETEGRDHPIQVALPGGSYVPVFIHKPTEELSPASANVTPMPKSESRADAGRSSRWVIPGWKYSAVLAILVLVAVGVYLYIRLGTSAAHSTLDANRIPTSISVPLQSEASPPIRILAGYSGPPRTDSAGRVWSADQYFSAGGNWQRDSGSIARASDQFLFEHSRTGDFSYNIPLKPGSYELHLFFSTPVRASDATSFNVSINGEFVLVGFEINADALGEDIADERVFRDISPGTDGVLRILFSAATGAPSLNAIEILPGVPHAQLPIRLITQTTPLTDHIGRLWYPDNYFMHGRLSRQTRPLTDSADPDLFSMERYGHFTYAIPADPRGRYTLILHFVEFYFGSMTVNGGAGSRLFKVMANGQTLLDNFDIYKEGGSLHEVTKTFHHLKPSVQGKLNLTFEPIANNATVSGIEVLDESR